MPSFRPLDDLTRLPLRDSLRNDFEHLGTVRPASLLLCDLDYLKLINDSLGHLAGDEVLRSLSATLQSRLGPNWRAYRFGGDEFAVLAPVSAAELEGWAEALLAALAQHPQPISLSIGLTELPAGEADLSEVMAEADRRLYAAKRRGRARVVAHNAPPGGFEIPLRRLLERENASAEAARWLSRARHQRGELDVQAPPGGGLSAFLEQVGVVARTLGYQTLHLSGHAARACQHLGSWHHALLDGQRLPPELEPSDFRAGARPLALLLDTPERFDAGTAAWLRPLLGQAQAVVRAQTGAQTAGRSGALIRLAPLSEQAVGALLTGPDGADKVASRWLWQRSGGRPAPLHRWMRVVRLEAELRREPLG
ncbi:GGDEF domain-containing protein [Deinococcus alpinitundrae]|uniref:GGDEF domain-containing protein n=1 Tax=Deinococcus alpinitundrae TaxID=468913 RepID=UPI00137B3D30|nr:GGDEF domain-containing protein [Deinococcus alpinitundrae]